MTQPTAASEAQQIHQAHIDALSKAMLHGRFDDFIAGFAMPHVLMFDGSEAEVTTVAESKTRFFAFHRTLAAQGTTDYVRLSKTAEFVTPDMICGDHQSHILRNGKWLVEPYAGRIVMERRDGFWLVTRAGYALMHKRDSVFMPRPSPNPEPPMIRPTRPIPKLPIPATRRSPQHAQD